MVALTISRIACRQLTPSWADPASTSAPMMPITIFPISPNLRANDQAGSQPRDRADHERR